MERRITEDFFLLIRRISSIRQVLNRKKKERAMTKREEWATHLFLDCVWRFELQWPIFRPLVGSTRTTRGREREKGSHFDKKSRDPPYMIMFGHFWSIRPSQFDGRPIFLIVIQMNFATWRQSCFFFAGKSCFFVDLPVKLIALVAFRSDSLLYISSWLSTIAQ